MRIEECDLEKDTILSEKVNKTEIIKKFLFYFDKNFDDVQNKSTLKILLNVMQNFIKNCETDDEISEMQIFLNNQGASEIMLNKLSDPDYQLSDELILAVIDFSIELLDQGNPQVQ